MTETASGIAFGFGVESGTRERDEWMFCVEPLSIAFVSPVFGVEIGIGDDSSTTIVVGVAQVTFVVFIVRCAYR